MNSFCVALILTTSIAGNEPTRWDFENAAVGKLPADWTATQTGKGEGSVWKIAEDKDAPNGPKVLAQTAAGPSSIFNVCVADKSSFADLDFSVNFKAFAGKKDQGGGPIWRFKDAKNYYVARMNPLEDNYRLYKVVDGKRSELASADVTAARGNWHTIRVVHKGEQIKCYFNGALHLEAKDGALKEAGKIGLWTRADAQTYFDDLVIRKPGD